MQNPQRQRHQSSRATKTQRDPRPRVMVERLEYKHKNAFLWGTHLFRDDLEHLCRLLGKSPSLINDECRYESIDELRERKGDAIAKLDVVAQEDDAGPRSIVVHFGMGVSISAYDKHLEFLQAKDFLDSKVHWTAKNIGWTSIIGFTVSVGTGIILMRFLASQGINSNVWFQPVWSIVMLLGAVELFKFNARSKSAQSSSAARAQKIDMVGKTQG